GHNKSESSIMKDDTDDEDAAASSSSSSSNTQYAATAYSNPRASRNMAEKQRRDNLNTQIATMASLVPTVSGGGSRKKDKISVLRLTAAHLRLFYTLGLPTRDFLPTRFNDIDLEQCMSDLLSGNSSFLVVLTATGKIIYVSRHVEQHLGHEQYDMIGDSLYNYTYSSDHEELTRNLTVTPPSNNSSNGNNGNSKNGNDSDNAVPTTTTITEGDDGHCDNRQSKRGCFEPQRRLFNIRLSVRSSSRRESPSYEYVQISGLLRLAHEVKRLKALVGMLTDSASSPTISTGSPGSEHNRSSNGSESPGQIGSIHGHSKKDLLNSTSNDIIFIGNARLLKKRSITELPLLEANKNEYFTRHLVDGRIIFCDHRISLVVGYMAEEVSGMSAFKYMHKDDVRWTMVALRHMYDEGTNYGSSCYRFITKSGDVIYLRTHGYLEFDETTHSVTSLICVNTLMSKEEGEKLIAEMKRKFSATILCSPAARAIRDEPFKAESESSTDQDDPKLDESNLEDALNFLVGDALPTVSVEASLSPPTLPDTQFVKAAMYSKNLPPASLQASQIGITDITPSGKGKGKPGSKNIEESSGSPSSSTANSTSNPKSVERHHPVAEKRIPELEDSPTTKLPESIIKEEVVLKTSPSQSNHQEVVTSIGKPYDIPEMKSENVSCKSSPPISSSFDDQVNAINEYMGPIQSTYPQQYNLKRMYSNGEEPDPVLAKKRAAPHFEPLGSITASDSLMSCINDELDFSTYGPVETIVIENNLQIQQPDYQSLHNNMVSSMSSESHMIDFQNLPESQLLSSTMENTEEMMNLLSNLPSTLNLPDETNMHSYVTNDGSLMGGLDKQSHLQVADCISSSETRIGDMDDSNVQ
ncbi:hypothetical protein QAD02_023538, partial [Eretmocerus hayati]